MAKAQTQTKTVAADTRTPEEKIREIAYKLWVEAGQPEGTAEHHWFQAIEIANNNAKKIRKATTAKTATKTPVKKPAAKRTTKATASKAA